MLDLKAAIIAQISWRNISPDSILLRYDANLPQLSITLLAYACCVPRLVIPKKIEEITEADLADLLAPLRVHQH